MKEQKPALALQSRTINWGKSVKYDDGQNPSVAINDKGDVFEVHATASTFKYGLWYHVGQADANDKIAWGESRDYDEGVNPRIAVMENRVAVEVHQSQSLFGMWYRFGYLKLDNKADRHIIWGTSVKYDQGQTPSVAISSSGIVVEVHQAESSGTDLWYHVGQPDVTKQRVDWGTSTRYDKGENPSVAVNKDGIVVEVHANDRRLWYRVGQVDTNSKKIAWGESIEYDPGLFPAIAINDSGVAVEVHQSNTASTLWYRVGQVDANSKKIAWGGSNKYTDGKSPTVSINNNGLVVEVHETDSKTKTGLWSCVGRIS